MGYEARRAEDRAVAAAPTFFCKVVNLLRKSETSQGKKHPHKKSLGAMRL